MNENKMGTMPIGKLLFQMSIPMVISMLVQALYNVVDSVFVSRFDADALTAVSTAFPIQNLMIGVGSGLGVGFSALVSRSLGEKDQDRANEVARQGIFLEGIGFILFFLIGLFAVKPFMLSQTKETAIVNYGVDYLSIVCCISIGLFAQMTFERLLQSTGRTFYSMITQGTGAIINIILDPIFIFGYFGIPSFGAKGAALATVVGQMVAACLALYFVLKKNPDVQIRFKGFKPHKEIIYHILEIGVPSVIMIAIGSIMTYFLNSLLYSFTAVAVSVFGVYFKVQSMVFMPIFGLNNGMVPIMAYNYGAKRADRMLQTLKYALVAAVSMMAVGITILQIFPREILMIFDANEEMMQIGVPALKTMSLAFIFAGICVTCGGVFQSLGKGTYSMIVSIARQLLVLLPAAYILAFVTKKVEAVWWSFPIAELMSLAASLVLIIRIYNKMIKPLQNVE